MEIINSISLAEIGFPHYVLYQDGHILNVVTNEWRIPQKGNEYVLWSIDKTQRIRVNSKHLLSFMFESPRRQLLCCWRNLGFLGFSKYEVTWDGRVYSLITYQYLTGNISFDGYYRVCVVNDSGQQRTEVVSRLVAAAFIPNPENKPEVNHISGDKSDNSVPNLEWSWGWENVHHALTHGLRKSVMTDELIHEICRRLERGDTVTQIMHDLEIPKHYVMEIKSGCHSRISCQYNIPRNKHFKSGVSNASY